MTSVNPSNAPNDSTGDFTVNADSPVPLEHEIQIRVRYQETDGQGRVHHTNYINYFEIARVEMLRASGRTYRDLESSGIMLVVTNVTCNYYQGAKDDDLLTVKTKVIQAKGVRIHHAYQIFLDDALLADGSTIVAAIAPTGKVTRLPKWLRMK